VFPRFVIERLRETSSGTRHGSRVVQGVVTVHWTGIIHTDAISQCVMLDKVDRVDGSLCHGYQMRTATIPTRWLLT
jgi:hypothetical protein